MALFKIFMGDDINKLQDPSNENYVQPVEGYAYYNINNQEFYIDAKYNGTTVSRRPINAYYAYSAGCDGASTPQTIHTTYIKNIAISNNQLSYTTGDGQTHSVEGSLGSGTTYTFTSGTNGFTVTPAGGTAQTVTITPSITNNITGSGTNGYLTKFNGTNTITDGPALGTDATKFLNNKGEWATPSYTTSLSLSSITNADDLKAIEDLSGTSGLLKKTAANTWTLDTNTYLTSHQSLTEYAKLASPALTGTPTAPTAENGTNNTQIATTAFVMNAFTTNDAMIFKGVLGTDIGMIASLPDTHYQGWTYKIGTAGIYAGQICEIGDTIYCVTDGTSANNAHWTVVQTNIDGAVIGPSSSAVDHVATFTGTTGKAIKDSGMIITKVSENEYTISFS